MNTSNEILNVEFTGRLTSLENGSEVTELTVYCNETGDVYSFIGNNTGSHEMSDDISSIADIVNFMRGVAAANKVDVKTFITFHDMRA